MSFGDTASNFHAWILGAEESETLLKRALDLVINFFDTANSYSASSRMWHSLPTAILIRVHELGENMELQ